MNVDRILVPTDFSEDAKAAAALAVDIAKQFDARIVLLHAYHVDIPIATPMVGAYTLPPGFYEELHAHAKSEVEIAAKELRSSGVDVVGISVSEPAATAIIAHAEEQAADLIVMGTRGLTGLKHVALGSVADRVVRMAPCPVLTVKANQ
jgi:universal stress protein A